MLTRIKHWFFLAGGHTWQGCDESVTVYVVRRGARALLLVSSENSAVGRDPLGYLRRKASLVAFF